MQEWDKIWTINKKIIDPVCPRHTAIEAAGRVLLHLTNAPKEPEVVIYPCHKKYPPAGNKATTRSQVGEEDPKPWQCVEILCVLKDSLVCFWGRTVCQAPHVLALPAL